MPRLSLHPVFELRFLHGDRVEHKGPWLMTCVTLTRACAITYLGCNRRFAQDSNLKTHLRTHSRKLCCYHSNVYALAFMHRILAALLLPITHSESLRRLHTHEPTPTLTRQLSFIHTDSFVRSADQYKRKHDDSSAPFPPQKAAKLIPVGLSTLDFRDGTNSGSWWHLPRAKRFCDNGMITLNVFIE